MKQFLTNLFQSFNDLQDVSTFMHQLIEHVPAGIVITQDNAFGANQGFYDLIGYTGTFNTIEDYLTTCKNDYILYKSFPEYLSSVTSFSRLYPLQTLLGQTIYVENSTSVFTHGEQTYYITTLTDCTESNNLSNLIEENNDRLRILEDLMDEYTFEYDLDNDVLSFSNRWKPDGINNQYPHAQKWIVLHEIVHPDERLMILDAMNSTRAFKEERVLEFRAKYLKEGYTWYRASYKLIRSKQTGSLKAIGKICNIDKERLFNADDINQENIDINTGLFVPAYMQSCVDQILEEESPDSLCALMLLQLDNFVEVRNEAGDLFISALEQTIAQELKNSFRTTDILGYSSEGCFMVFLRKVPEHIVTTRANEILDKIRKAESTSPSNPQLSCSIGIAISPLDSRSYMELFLKADSAMYLSKARGGNTYSYFNTEVDTRQRNQ